MKKEYLKYIILGVVVVGILLFIAKPATKTEPATEKGGKNPKAPKGGKGGGNPLDKLFEGLKPTEPKPMHKFLTQSEVAMLDAERKRVGSWLDYKAITKHYTLNDAPAKARAYFIAVLNAMFEVPKLGFTKEFATNGDAMRCFFKGFDIRPTKEGVVKLKDVMVKSESLNKIKRDENEVKVGELRYLTT